MMNEANFLNSNWGYSMIWIRHVGTIKKSFLKRQTNLRVNYVHSMEGQFCLVQLKIFAENVTGKGGLN